MLSTFIVPIFWGSLALLTLLVLMRRITDPNMKAFSRSLQLFLAIVAISSYMSAIATNQSLL